MAKIKPPQPYDILEKPRERQQKEIDKLMNGELTSLENLMISLLRMGGFTSNLSANEERKLARYLANEMEKAHKVEHGSYAGKKFWSIPLLKIAGAAISGAGGVKYMYTGGKPGKHFFKQMQSYGQVPTALASPMELMQGGQRTDGSHRKSILQSAKQIREGSINTADRQAKENLDQIQRIIEQMTQLFQRMAS